MAEKGLIKNESRSLVKFELDALEVIQPDYRELIRAKYEPRIATYNQQQQIDYMKVIVKELMIHIQSNHLQLPTDQLETMIHSFAVMAVGELKSLATKYTMTEAKIALREGYRGSYTHIVGDIFGLSAVNFAKCFRAFDTWEKRLEAQKAFHKAIDHPTTEKPVTEMFKPNMELAMQCFETYKAEPKAMTGTVYSTETSFFHLPTIFNFLVDNFIVTFSQETKETVKESAKKQYEEFSRSGLTRQEIKDGKLKILMDSIDYETNRTYEFYCDAEGLRVLFSKLIERGKTLTDLKKKQ